MSELPSHTCGNDGAHSSQVLRLSNAATAMFHITKVRKIIIIHVFNAKDNITSLALVIGQCPPQWETEAMLLTGCLGWKLCLSCLALWIKTEDFCEIIKSFWHAWSCISPQSAPSGWDREGNNLQESRINNACKEKRTWSLRQNFNDVLLFGNPMF